jgi:hypothetical protein
MPPVLSGISYLLEAVHLSLLIQLVFPHLTLPLYQFLCTFIHILLLIDLCQVLEIDVFIYM